MPVNVHGQSPGGGSGGPPYDRGQYSYRADHRNAALQQQQQGGGSGGGHMHPSAQQSMNHHHQMQQQQQPHHNAPHHHHPQPMTPSQQQNMQHHPLAMLSQQQQHPQAIPHHRQSVQGRLNYSGSGGGGGGGGGAINGTDALSNRLMATNLDGHGGPGPSNMPPYGGGQQQQQQQQPEDDGVNGLNENENHALMFLGEVVRKLYDNPGMFETFQKELTALFLDFTQNHFVMSNAVEMIFEQSINEQNFRYMGARLCRLLDGIDVGTTSLFRTLLCLKMQDHQNQLPTFVQNEAHKVRGTTLFLAELYMQLQNDGHRIIEIAYNIVETIQILLQKTTPENVKSVCQALKLCGYELEMDCSKQTEEIIGQLEQVKDIDNSTQRMLQSVLELRQKRWGRSEAISMAPIVENITQDYSDGPVFYGPDGQVLTEEENSFLLSNIPAYPNVNFDDFNDNDPDELVEPDPEMDLEIQMAFKDFVKGQTQKPHNP